MRLENLHEIWVSLFFFLVPSDNTSLIYSNYVCFGTFSSFRLHLFRRGAHVRS